MFCGARSLEPKGFAERKEISGKRWSNIRNRGTGTIIILEFYIRFDLTLDKSKVEEMS
jgi:hypothetical protein